MNLRDRITDSRIIRQSEKSCVLLASLRGFRNKVILKERPGDSIHIYELLSKIRNPHLPIIYGFQQEEESLLIAEEWIPGKTLAELLSRRCFSFVEALDLMLQLCDGIEAMHSSSPPLIHRDITPWNLMLTREHLLKIIDFDAARIYRPHLLRDTRQLGTREYAPPEQFGFSQTDIRSDIYSMGVLFYELLYCKAFVQTLDFPSQTYLSLRKANAVIARCTMFAPNQRYQSVGELRRALLRILPYRARRQYRKSD